jgi:4-carboxymuconolactone decarboxylase
MDERQRLEQGMKVRRTVLGDAHVDQAQEKRDDFTDGSQDLITRYAWGEIWTRHGLSKQTRSMITLAMMVALNPPDELRMHLRAALNNGVTRGEIRKFFCNQRFIATCPRPLPHSTWLKNSFHKETNSPVSLRLALRGNNL